MSHAHAPARRPFLLAAAIALAFALLMPSGAAAHGGGHHHRQAVHHPAAKFHPPGRHHPRGKSHNHGSHHHWHHGKPHGDHGRGKVVGTMTRNLYLGADLTPAIQAKSLEEFVAKNGQILREVTANDFPTRAEGLADEILNAKPDLVGLQEVALWRTAPANFEVLSKGPSATTVRYDYLQELLGELNKGKPTYEVVVVQPEFDFEAPADEDENPATGPFGADINGRLTMNDVILARRGAGVQTANATAGHFVNLLPVEILGNQIPVTRGWTATDAKVRGSHWFRFVNTHLEAFDPSFLVPSFRAKQAAELVAPGGPATSDLPVVLVGDLNSDDDTVEPGDRQAYETLVAAGMVERSTATPLSCCLNSSLLAVGKGGSEADFDHQVDHIMTRNPEVVTLQSSSVSGIQPVNGFWNSDHAGLFSALRFDD
ncbi:MAG TPA: endonuclease/exonuclease/phosphatase family protein [Solirubrobacterales bacterium]|nr:endonuclease/exonuclease/phosphatase family protein [Solirubrobacterales bacterium]